MVSFHILIDQSVRFSMHRNADFPPCRRADRRTLTEAETFGRRARIAKAALGMTIDDLDQPSVTI